MRWPNSGYGHDKSKAILPYRDLPSKPTLFFCGDGVSGTFLLVDFRMTRFAFLLKVFFLHGLDMSAAAHADLLFVKQMANGDSDLATYCEITS